MIQQEELHIKHFTTGVTFFIFSDVIYDNLPENPDQYEGPFPSYVVFNSQNQIYSLNYFTGNTIWTRNANNNYIPIGETGWIYKTGHTIVKTVASNLSQENIDNTTSLMLSRLSDPNRTGTPSSASAATNYVFYDKKLIDDFYVDLKLERSYNSLDTLKINNNLLNSFPEQNSPTGVVFGRLTAIQKIKGETGESLRIPLVNVPVGIFNSSDEFPSLFSVDDNGNRLTLNLKEASSQDQYFNDYSYFSDYNNYLKSAESFSAVPAQYKYVTLTNENGEFILYDIPVGQQTAIFEVDLFKQGLTKDEIALNFFPFPGTEDANIDSTPSFVYKQFPIDVVPSWGIGQTGYTSLDININLDLRKWATFYVSPMAYNGYKLGSNELSSLQPYVNLDVRDMSKVGFPTSNISLVEVQDITLKDKNQSLLWENEFSTLVSTVRFYKHGFNVFKVRANMYDPDGYKTNSDGIPMISSYSKGVWLAGYQFKFYYNKPSEIFRTTGFQRDWGKSTPKGWVGRDNFHLNRNITSDVNNSNVVPNFSFPYDKPWSCSYPEPYKIPRKPAQLNFDRYNSNSRLKDSNGKIYLEQPLYKDGDLIGLRLDKVVTKNDDNVGGYGAQYRFGPQAYIHNRFSQEVTSLYMYKYESGVSWSEKYSNGYEPSNSSYPVQPNISKVVDGEKYQRVECGYGYWLRPDGLPPISYENYGDLIFPAATKVGDTLASGTYGPGVLDVGQVFENSVVKVQNQYIDIYNIDDMDICVALDSYATFSEGGLDIYRIVNPNDLVPPGMNVIPTFAKYIFKQFYFQRDVNGVDRLSSAYNNSNGSGDDEMFAEVGNNNQATSNYQNLNIRITNNGSINVEINSKKIQPGNSEVFTASELGLNNGSITLPGNSDFDFNTGKYNTANYSMQFQNVVFTNTNRTPYSRDIASVVQSATENTPNYYLVSDAGPLRTQYDDGSGLTGAGCQTTFNSGKIGGPNSKWEHYVTMDGAFFDIQGTGGGGSVNTIRFQSSTINTSSNYCGSNSYNNGVKSIPIQHS
jgi:hypothetical protein